jgi:hypothetical protein
MLTSDILGHYHKDGWFQNSLHIIIIFVQSFIFPIVTNASLQRHKLIQGHQLEKLWKELIKDAKSNRRMQRYLDLKVH